MIKALLSFTKEGLFVRADVSGHAGAGIKGSDPVCAAVSHHIRTAAAVLMKAAPGCRYSAKEEGRFVLDLSGADFGKKAEIEGITDFFLTGLKLLAAENPDFLRLELQEGDSDGT